MKPAALNFVKDLLEDHLFDNAKVLIDCPADVALDAWTQGANLTFAKANELRGLKVESFDFSILLGSLENSPNFFNYLREIRRVLKPGGMIIVTTAGMNESARWRFTEKSLAILLEGFEGIKTEGAEEGRLICAYAWKKPKQAANPTEAAQTEGALRC